LNVSAEHARDAGVLGQHQYAVPLVERWALRRDAAVAVDERSDVQHVVFEELGDGPFHVV
jgi:hypothetical protein